MIVGGGDANLLIEKFVKLAGGENAKIVVIPTAGETDEFAEDWDFGKLLKEFGANSVSVVHTRDPKKADTEEFCAPFKEATGVWFTGGRQWRLVDAYMNTQVVKECWKVLERGGIIGGSSAGATIQGSYLARGDTKDNTIMMGDHEEGFGFLKNVAIDQHLLARNRQFDMFEILKEKPELLGIGLDESTAILVEKDTFEVIGKTYVAVYDGNFWRRDGNPVVPEMQSFYILRPGDKYDLKNRSIIEGK
jgi:cyanophycinase